MVLTYTVNDNNKSINQIINENFHLSNRLFLKLLNNKEIFLNDKNVDTRKIANIGDNILINLDYEEDNSNIVPTKIDLNILYEDDALLVLNKSAGIAVHPSILHYDDSLSNGVRYYYDEINLKKKIRPVNRLDYNTSGLIIFAKNEYIQENLIRQMKTGSFNKEYLAVAQGHFEDTKGIINVPIKRKEKSIIERCVSKDGQPSITEYEILKEYKKENHIYSLVKCHLLTGRTHQIRVHMSYIGHPLVGDTLYGNSSDKIKRQALHSYKISFMHPITNEYFEILSNLPDDINIILS